MLDRFNEKELNLDVYLEAKSIDPEVNKKRVLGKLKYNPINKTIEIKGIDGKPYRCKVTFASNDLLSGTGTGAEGIGMMKRAIYASQMPDGTPYIRIPPHYFKEFPPSELLPVIEHEAEHVRQMLNKKQFGKQSNSKEVTYVEARDKKAVIDYTKDYIQKHPIALNKHDKLEYELLADFHAALKYGRKSYAKALRNLSYYNFSIKKFKKASEDAYNDLFPLLELYSKGVKTVGPYKKKLEKRVVLLKKALKNIKEAEKNNRNNEQISKTLLGDIKAKDQYANSVSATEILLNQTQEQLDLLKNMDPNDKVPDEILNGRKIENSVKKVTTALPLLIATFGRNVVSTEYRLKFLKEIMKDKPWLKDDESKYRTTYEAYVPLEFDDWDIDDALFQEEFKDELIAGADVDYDTFTEEYIDTLAEYLFN